MEVFDHISEPKDFPIIHGEDLLTETAFYKWLQERRKQWHNDTHFIPTIKEYTGHVEAPFKGRKDGTAHKYVFECFWRDINKAQKLTFN